MMKTDFRKKTALQVSRYFFYSGVIESIFALLFLLLIPGDPKNALVFGLSSSRLFLATVMSIIILIHILFSVLALRNSARLERGNIWVQKMLGKFGDLLPWTVITFALVFCGGFLIYFNYLNNNDLVTRAGIILRLSPFVILAFTRMMQLGASFFYLLSKMGKSISPSKNDFTIPISPQKVIFVLASIALLLILISVMVDITEQFNTWKLPMWGLRQKVDLDREANIPTFFSAMLLVISATLTAIIAFFKRRRKEPYRLQWSLLSLIFLFLAIDETSVLHELLGKNLLSPLKLAGVFSYNWVVLGIVFVSVLGIIYLKFILDLPKIHKKRFASSMFIFFLGALGIEMLAGWYFDTFPNSWLADLVLTSVEESIEMIGVILMIHFLLNYIKELYPQFGFSVVDPTDKTDQHQAVEKDAG